MIPLAIGKFHFKMFVRTAGDTARSEIGVRSRALYSCFIDARTRWRRYEFHFYSHAVLVTHGRVRFPKDGFAFSRSEKSAPEFRTAGSPELGRNVSSTSPLRRRQRHHQPHHQPHHDHNGANLALHKGLALATSLRCDNPRTGCLAELVALWIWRCGSSPLDQSFAESSESIARKI